MHCINLVGPKAKALGRVAMWRARYDLAIANAKGEPTGRRTVRDGMTRIYSRYCQAIRSFVHVATA